MSRFSRGIRTAAGSTVLPIASVYAAAAAGGAIKEVHAFNSAATEVALKLVRLNTAGTKPAALTDAEYDEGANGAQMNMHTTHTVGPTIGEEFQRAILGAAIGSGFIWTFGDKGLIIPVGVANGIGLIVSVGTGQVCDVTFVWDE